MAYHRVSRGLYRNICPCRRRNEYIMNGRFSYKKYGDRPCQKWACLRSFFGMRLCVPACNIKWHSRGKGFDPPHLHHKQPASVWMRAVAICPCTVVSPAVPRYKNDAPARDVQNAPVHSLPPGDTNAVGPQAAEGGNAPQAPCLTRSPGSACLRG